MISWFLGTSLFKGLKEADVSLDLCVSLMIKFHQKNRGMIYNLQISHAALKKDISRSWYNLLLWFAASVTNECNFKEMHLLIVSLLTAILYLVLLQQHVLYEWFALIQG